MKKFNDLSSDKQVTFLLGLTENISYLLIGTPHHCEFTQALDICWKWLEDKSSIKGDEIYRHLENGDEENVIFLLMEEETDFVKSLAWDCLCDAVCYTSWKAYQFDKEKYVPSPIENICEELSEQFLSFYYDIDENNKTIADNFLNHLSNANPDIDRISILNYLKTLKYD